MRAKLVLLVLPLFVAGALAFDLSTVDVSAQEAMMKQGETGGQQATPRPRRRSRARATRGVPKGVSKCLERLTELASAEPMAAYEGQAQQIVNDGLLSNDPKSNCSIGDDAKLRLKVTEMATAWRAKDASKVQSLLQEIKSAAPQS